MTDRPRIAVLMDPIQQIKPAKDSTLAMLLAAQARGCDLLYFEQRHLWVRDGRAYARLQPVTVRNDPADWFTLGEPAAVPLEQVDAVLMRKDPPFDMEYVYSTYLLELAENQGARVINSPRAIRDHNEKLAIAKFPQFTAPTLVTRQEHLLRD